MTIKWSDEEELRTSLRKRIWNLLNECAPIPSGQIAKELNITEDYIHNIIIELVEQRRTGEIKTLD